VRGDGTAEAIEIETKSGQKVLVRFLDEVVQQAG
jgi:hypothetical protein